MATTYGSALAKIGVTLPQHLVADVEVPILTKPQDQGDLKIVPADLDEFDTAGVDWVPVPDNGIQVVVGEATGNAHWLHRGFDSPGVLWARLDQGLLLAVVRVPEGESGELIHTDEHGCNAFGAGDYVIRGKQELADQIRRVAD